MFIPSPPDRRLLVEHLEYLRCTTLQKPHTHASQTHVTEEKNLLNASMQSPCSALTRTHTITAAMHVFVLTQQTNQARADWPDWGLVTGGVHREGGVTRWHAGALDSLPLCLWRKGTNVEQTLFGQEGACMY